jgi:ferredoxin
MQHGRFRNDSQTYTACASCTVRVDDERLQMWISPEEFMCCARYLI